MNTMTRLASIMLLGVCSISLAADKEIKRAAAEKEQVAENGMGQAVKQLQQEMRKLKKQQAALLELATMQNAELNLLKSNLAKLSAATHEQQSNNATLVAKQSAQYQQPQEYCTYQYFQAPVPTVFYVQPQSQYTNH